jgi:hypothetical protein
MVLLYALKIGFVRLSGYCSEAQRGGGTLKYSFEFDTMGWIKQWNSFSPCTPNAQDDGTVLLHRAAHCLAAKNFLPPSKAEERTFGYLLDEKSYPGEKMLYVVEYPKLSRTDGFMFTIFLTDHDGRQGFNIQNNARFALSKDGDEGVSFVSPPLGGTWTHEHLVSAIKQIEKQPKFMISSKDMLTIDSSISCEAYTDPQPERK